MSDKNLICKRNCCYKKQTQVRVEEQTNFYNKGKHLKDVEQTTATNKRHRTCTTLRARSRRRNIKNAEEEEEENEQEIVVKQEVSGRKSMNVTTNCNYNYNTNYNFNKINQAFNSVKTTANTTTTVNMLSITTATAKTCASILLSILSRVFLFSLLLLLSTTTTPQITTRSLTTTTTVAGTLLAMQILPIKFTATAAPSATTTNLNHDYDVSTTAVLQQSRQQLFALLKQQPDIMKQQSHEIITVGRELLRKSRGGGVPGLPLDDDDDDEDSANVSFVGESSSVVVDDDDADIDALSLKLMQDYAQKNDIAFKKKPNKNKFLETIGFVADDGQQQSATTSNMSSQQQRIYAAANVKHCPSVCKCLDDFFNCGKLQLETVPDLPDYVEHLDLVGNRLTEFTAVKVQNLTQLHKLSLKRNQLEHMPKFIGLHSLKHLNLANNRIRRIDSAALLSLPKLKSLDLTRNNLHSVEANFFPTDNRLAHL